jgi:hypothetical protein
VTIALGLLAACGGTDVQATPPTTTQAARPVPAPDLTDPAVRRRFVCSFAPGSFGIPPATAAGAARRDGCDDGGSAG